MRDIRAIGDPQWREGGAHEVHNYCQESAPGILVGILNITEFASNANSTFCYFYLFVLCWGGINVTAYVERLDVNLWESVLSLGPCSLDSGPQV